MRAKPSKLYGPSGVRRRALVGAVLLLVLIAVAGLIAYATRGGRTPSKEYHPQASSPPSPTPTAAASSRSSTRHQAPPAPPSTRDPIAFGKAAAVALWSYDTRTYSRATLLKALHGWMTSEKKYADTASVDVIVPSPPLWREMAANGQYATAKATGAHFPAAFTEALQADPGAIRQAYVYAVTVTGRQSIAWKGSPRGGGEVRATTLAVQCRPSRPCALAGVLPAVAP
jgi:hypothetical protein